MDKKEVIHGLSSKEDALASKKSIIHRFNVPVSVVSEPKPECDHIVGVEFGCEECQERNELTKLSEIANIETKENCTWFKHCPECGEKLNITK